MPSGTVTLAGVLKSHGYRTAAFIGGFDWIADSVSIGVSTFTIARSLYPTQGETDAADLKRLGEDVTRSATAWIEKNAGAPFFVFCTCSISILRKIFPKRASALSRPAL